MTVMRRDGCDASPYFRWFREERSLDSKYYGISVTDNDHWIHRYSTRGERNGRHYPYDSIMLVELKAFSSGMPFAQADTLDIVGILIRTWTSHGRRRMVVIRDTRHGRIDSKRRVLCYGKHVLTMSGTRPDESEKLLWDGKSINIDWLLEIYRFERDPDHPSKFVDLRRHHKRPVSETHPQLDLRIHAGNDRISPYDPYVVSPPPFPRPMD